MAAHAHVAPAEVIFEPAIDALGAAALVVAQVLGACNLRSVSASNSALAPGLRRGFLSMIGT